MNLSETYTLSDKRQVVVHFFDRGNVPTIRPGFNRVLQKDEYCVDEEIPVHFVSGAVGDSWYSPEQIARRSYAH